MKVLESFDVTPNTNLLDVLGHAGYSLPSAIADIMDNSITAKANNIWLDMKYDGEGSYIIICDDGFGMSLDKLKQASTIAFRDMFDERSMDDLGRFSTGLNSASESMCEQLIIQSKTIGKEANTIVLDYRKMKQNGWKCDVIESEQKYIRTNAGTAIIWKRLKSIASGRTREEFFQKIANVEKHISHVFGNYIRDGLRIHINGDNNVVDCWDPFYTDNDKTSLIYDEKQEYHGSFISSKIYILPPYNNLGTQEQAYMIGYGLSEQQGFYIYRQNRLIKEGGWLGLEGLSISNKYDYARIRIDIDTTLDKYFEPNFMKSDIVIPSDLVDYFTKLATKARRESNKSFNYMKAPSLIRSIKKDKQIPVWNYKSTRDGILLSVNEDHPIIKSLLAPLKNSDKKRLCKLLSKNIPIGEITRSGVSKKQTSYDNIDQEMIDMFERLSEDGLEKSEIMKRMVSCEPFCLSDDYIGKLISFFEEKGVL